MDAIDYLIKPVEQERFRKAVDKALAYHSLLLKEEKEAIETIASAEYFFVKAELKAISDLLPKATFLRVNKTYIVITAHIESFDNNDIFIKSYEIAIGNSYRDDFFEGFVMRQRR